jgi:hypothetical protein
LFGTYLNSPEFGNLRGETLDIEHNLYNRFSDPAIREKAKSSLLIALKVILQRNRLILSWYETEFLKNQVYRQLHEMNCQKDIRPLIQLKPLPFNFSGFRKYKIMRLVKRKTKINKLMKIGSLAVKDGAL